MRMITFTKKKIKRIAVAGVLAAATVAVGVGAVLTSVGTKAAERMLPIYSVDRGDKKISLTFDVAWENSNTDDLIEILGEFDARATFFVTGDWCDRYPEDVLKFYNAGHEIQNHSDRHPHVQGINVNDLISDTREAARKITMITGEQPTLYRAPYGEYDDSMLTTLEGMGYKVIQWDVDSIDWQEPTPDEIKSRILDGTKSGSILLFHNDLDNTTEALPQILTELKNGGYEFVPVSELIYSDNYTMDSSGKQIPNSQSSLDLSADNIDEVMKQYSDSLSEMGLTDEQMAMAAAAVKGGAEIPASVYDAITQVSGMDARTISEPGSPDDTAEPADDNLADYTMEAGEESGGSSVQNNQNSAGAPAATPPQK